MRFSKHIHNHVIRIASIGGVIAILGTSTFLALKRLRQRDVLKFRTKLGRARIYAVCDDEGHLVRLLEVDGIVQSGTYVNEGNEDALAPAYTDLVFDYLKKYDLVFQMNDQIERICVLGCGGYDYPEHLIAHHDNVIVDAVEIDPIITALAQRYFYLDRLIEEFNTEETGRLNLICADALAHLFETTTTYDVIVNDTYDGGRIPPHLANYPFYTAVKRRLNPGGIFATNIVSARVGSQSHFLQEQVDLMKQVFDVVEIYPCDTDDPYSFDNVIVIAH